MTTLQHIKDDQLTARKNHDAVTKNLLTTLIGEIENELKSGRSKDEQTVIQATIASFVKKSREFQHLTTNIELMVSLKQEEEILVSYMPKQLTDDELRVILDNSLVARNKGQLMSFLKTNYSGQYDGRQASGIIDLILK